jgi:hypothetical protein
MCNAQKQLSTLSLHCPERVEGSKGAFHMLASSFDKLCPELVEGLRMTFSI